MEIIHERCKRHHAQGGPLATNGPGGGRPGRKRDSYLAPQYHRLVARRGKKKAAGAVGHSILVIAYHLLRRASTYQDLGYLYFDQRQRRATEHRLVRRLEGLGYKVSLESAAA